MYDQTYILNLAKREGWESDEENFTEIYNT